VDKDAQLATKDVALVAANEALVAKDAQIALQAEELRHLRSQYH
jgi:hypothetical protein